MKKLYLLSTLMLVMMVAMLQQNVKAQVSVWDGTSSPWTQGTGTETDPFLIESSQQLAWIADMVNSGIQTYDGVFFLLITDLDMNNLQWIPIGNSMTNCFNGRFNGGNHTISKVNITSSNCFVGLFGIINGSSRIEYLHVESSISIPNSTGDKYVGGIVGAMMNTSNIVRNCSHSGNITAGANELRLSAGGVVGLCHGGKILNCNNTGNVIINDAKKCAVGGGIVGIVINGYSVENGQYLYQLMPLLSGVNVFLPSDSYSEIDYNINNNGCVIAKCYNTGNVISTSHPAFWYEYNNWTHHYSEPTAGGICGVTSTKSVYSNINSLKIEECYNRGDILAKTTVLPNDSNNQTISPFSGGIVGCVANYWDSITINKCYNTGGISTSAEFDHDISGGYESERLCTGGLIGYLTPGSINSPNFITNCYNSGIVSAPTWITNSISAGIIAGQTNSGFHLENCYNSGQLSGSKTTGLHDNVNNTNAINNYYLDAYYSESSCGMSKTEGSMKSSSFPLILNSDSTVYSMDSHNINRGYPIFNNYTYVQTKHATEVGLSQAKLNGIYSGPVAAVGFQYKKINTPTFTTVYSDTNSPTLHIVNGLEHETQYVYRIFAESNGMTYYGQLDTFLTSTCDLQVNISTSQPMICEGDSSYLTATATSSFSNSFVYNWSTGSFSPTILVFDDLPYTITVSDIYGCSAVQMISISKHPKPTIQISGNTEICNGQTTQLTANGDNYILWNNGSTLPTITVAQPGIYIATTQNSYGCTASDTVVVTTFGNPVITGNLVFCSGEYTTLTATGGDSYVWSTGATTSSINVNTEGSYTVTANTSSGCSGSATVNVIQLQTNEATITGNSLICSGIGTVLTASSGSSYLWSTGETTPSISVNNPGTYAVTVTNSYGCSSSASQTVSLMEPITISGNSHICSGESTILSATGTGSYQWSNGANTPSITVNTPGTYSVTVSLPNGCSSSAAIEVTAASSPTPSISGNNVICEGQSTTLTATGGNSYSWSNGSTQNSIVVTQNGNYTVTVTNTDGCSASTSTMVTVNPLPNVTISGNSSFCQDGSTTLTASGANTYLWSNASVLESISVSNAGTYIVTGTDVNGCTNTASQTVTVNPTYNIPLTHSICEGESYNFYGQNLTSAGTYTHTLQTINGCDSVLTLTLTVKTLPTTSITGNTSICEGQSTTLTATGGNSYSWSTGSTNSSISVNQSGVYTVTATNAEGCSASTSTTVTTNPLPTITISGNTTVCQGSSTTLTASGADSYSWSTGENTASVSISSFGVYTVTGTSAEGCSSTADVTVLVSQLPVITISGETDFCAGESTTLTANGGTSYLWSDGTTEASITVNTAGTYQVIGYNTAGCNSMESVTVNQWQPASSEFTITTNENCYEWNGQSYCQTGDYTQTLQTIHGCDSIVTLHLTIETGINDHNMNASMNVYPNPTSDKVNVQLAGYNGQSENMEIQLFDIYGKLLQTVPVTNENMQIDLSPHAQGVYFIKAVIEGNVLAVRKVVKNR